MDYYPKKITKRFSWKKVTLDMFVTCVMIFTGSFAFYTVAVSFYVQDFGNSEKIISKETLIKEKTKERIVSLPAKGVSVSLEGASIVPQYFEIPALAVSAFVEHVGISHNGDMMAPSNFKDVGWYKYGARPGEEGNAFIVGHVDNSFGLPGVFKNIKNLHAGDDIYIKGGSGKILHYKVVGKKLVSHTEESVSHIAGPAHGRSRLILITCHGEWVKEARTYDSRLVVVAELQV